MKCPKCGSQLLKKTCLKERITWFSEKGDLKTSKITEWKIECIHGHLVKKWIKK